MTRKELLKICDETNTNKKGIETLLKIYTQSNGWSEEEAVNYAYKLIKDGTIENIKVLGAK